MTPSVIIRIYLQIKFSLGCLFFFVFLLLFFFLLAIVITVMDAGGPAGRRDTKWANATTADSAICLFCFCVPANFVNGKKEHRKMRRKKKGLALQQWETQYETDLRNSAAEGAKQKKKKRKHYIIRHPDASYKVTVTSYNRCLITTTVMIMHSFFLFRHWVNHHSSRTWVYTHINYNVLSLYARRAEKVISRFITPHSRHLLKKKVSTLSLCPNLYLHKQRNGTDTVRIPFLYQLKLLLHHSLLLHQQRSVYLLIKDS